MNFRRPTSLLLFWSVLGVSLVGTNCPCSADEASNFPGRGSRADWNRAARLGREAAALRESGKLDAALAKLNQAVTVYPYDPVFYYNLGMYLNANKNFAQSAKQFERALELNPQFVMAYSKLASVERQMGQFDSAERNLRKALVLQPKNYEALFSLGNLLVSSKKFDEAKMFYQQAAQAEGADKATEIAAALRNLESQRALSRTQSAPRAAAAKSNRKSRK